MQILITNAILAIPMGGSRSSAVVIFIGDSVRLRFWDGQNIACPDHGIQFYLSDFGPTTSALEFSRSRKWSDDNM